MSFDAEYEWDLALEQRDREIEDAEAALAYDDDRARRCIVCGDPLGIRCCEFSRDFA